MKRMYGWQRGNKRELVEEGTGLDVALAASKDDKVYGLAEKGAKGRLALRFRSKEAMVE